MADEEMEFEGPEELSEEGETKPKKSKKKLIILVLLVVILGAGGFFGWQFFMGGDEEAPKGTPAASEEAKGAKPGEPAKEGEEKPAAAEGAGKDQERPGNVMALDPFIVNLADPSGKRYLKLSLSVDAQNEQLRQEIEARIPVIRDSILLLLTSKSYEDIASVAGKIRLRNEILKVINRSLGGVGSVHAVYFTEFVIQ